MNKIKTKKNSPRIQFSRMLAFDVQDLITKNSIDIMMQGQNWQGVTIKYCYLKFLIVN